MTVKNNNMALQSSGQISLEDIANELGDTLSNVSLGSMSDDAGFGEPDAVSDFYGYSAVTAISFNSSTGASTSNNVCQNSINQTYYHNNGSGGTTSYVEVNDYVYSDSALTTKLSSGYYKIGSAPYDWVQVNGFGRVFATGICL